MKNIQEKKGKMSPRKGKKEPRYLPLPYLRFLVECLFLEQLCILEEKTFLIYDEEWLTGH